MGRFGAAAAIVTVAAAISALLACGEKPNEPLIIGTTTSVADSGLLQHLAAAFEKEEGITLRWHSVGSGRALRMAEAGEVDLAITHDPDAERRILATGAVESQRKFMRNDFVIVGPPANPARIAATDKALDAMRKIATSQARFCSRGDESGTHAREKKLWKEAGVDPVANPSYLVMGQPMGALLRAADQQDAYALADLATFESLQQVIALDVLCSGDPALENVYVVTVMKRRGMSGDASRFADWLTSDDGRLQISAFRPKGRPLFHPIRG